jgi:hypothetical protein
MGTINENKLKASWTKYDAVKVIELISEGKLKANLDEQDGIDKPVLRAFLGISSLQDPIPHFWEEIKRHPKQIKQFALIAALTTHISLIKKFAEKYSQSGQMGGTFVMESGKEYTNIRSALVISGASLENYRRAHEVPYNFYALFENGEVGILMKYLLIERLNRIGYNLDESTETIEFVALCIKHDFIKALGLDRHQFKRWIEGVGLSKEDRFSFDQLKIYKEIPMLEVNQWMNDWDDVRFDDELRKKPQPKFYLLSIDARLLKKISDVHRRSPQADDKNVQRKASDDRISEIRNYIEGGFPWSTLSKQDQKNGENSRLKMPGLLPTAIIANIMPAGAERNRKKLALEDEIKIIDEEMSGKKLLFPKLIIPDHIFERNDWNPDLKPLEIIDGQHRLWAFDENQSLSGNYELPVVLFNNLDRAWQAYLFYTINIKPVKINTSLGFDLYPLLRTQEWLEGPKNELLAYREAMSQEIVEALWLYETSPWRNRINMLGEAGGETMSQAAFIRTLVNSFFKKSNGLFSYNTKSNQVIEWNRAQQAAFIILLWQKIESTVNVCNYEWAEMIRKEESEQQTLFENSKIVDKAFSGRNSFLSRDQGVRGLLNFANDFFFTATQYTEIDFNSPEWESELDEKSISNESITIAIGLFQQNLALIDLIENFSFEIAKVDWRTTSARFNNDAEKEHQMKYRGSGGYSEFWKDIHSQFLDSGDKLVRKYANQIQK